MTHEKVLGEFFLEEHSSDIFSIEKFPASVRPFYSLPNPEDHKYTNSFDIFLRGQEVLSGSQRIHQYDNLSKSMQHRDPPLDVEGETLRHYSKGFQYGCAPHGGGCFGLNRVLQFVLGLPDIRLATMFPRDPSRISP
jgi:aspartyl-tRNA synthetase